MNVVKVFALRYLILFIPFSKESAAGTQMVFILITSDGYFFSISVFMLL